ncbi:flagellar hook-length control protein FliK [Phenylobacterium deserti]|uniref:Flagellar hook-length control protein-like C-terminal domain-containing protein n=1 Tax=Phenylobacterium deserti TaxID=1914756 RepID=A0A328AAM9_9CAUL|nr:flagellar hook-length control protein FliK [Phenylobacterium deserti]RAK51487.1 hypothetical protein DJ018_16265 [Phenylobacterium deserti]
MSVTASITNPLASQQGLGAQNPAAGAGSGVLGVFDAMFASLFAQAEGEAGQATLAAGILGTGATAPSGSLLDAQMEPPQPEGALADGEAPAAAVEQPLVGPDAAMLAVLSGAVAAPVSPQPTTVKTVSSEDAAGGGASQPASPLLAEPTTSADLAPRAALDGQAASKQTEPTAAAQQVALSGRVPPPVEPEQTVLAALQPSEAAAPSELALETPGAKPPIDKPAADTANVRSPNMKAEAPKVTTAAAPPQAQAQTQPAPPPAAPAAQAEATPPIPVQAIAAQAAAPAAKPAARQTEASPVAPSSAPAKGKDRSAHPGRVEAHAAEASLGGPQLRPGSIENAPSVDAVAARSSRDQTALAADQLPPEPVVSEPLASAPMTTASAAHPEAEVLPTAAPVRGSPETVANLAAQVIKKLEGRTTRFDLQLDPLGLGRVDVRLEIGAQGQVSAAMSFDNPQAAAELKARASELQKVLEQAGFDLSGGLSFDVAGDPNGSGRQAQNQDQSGQGGATFRGRAFEAALNNAGEAASAAVNSALYLRRAAASGVDVRI